MITFLSCQCRICKDCVAGHLTFLIKERNIHQLVCPVCGLPDLTDEAEATEYFNNLDIMVSLQMFPFEICHNVFRLFSLLLNLEYISKFVWIIICAFSSFFLERFMVTFF